MNTVKLYNFVNQSKTLFQSLSKIEYLPATASTEAATASSSASAAASTASTAAATEHKIHKMYKVWLLPKHVL